MESREDGYARNPQRTAFLSISFSINPSPYTVNAFVQAVLHITNAADEALCYLAIEMLNALHNLLENSQFCSLKERELYYRPEVNKFNVEEVTFSLMFREEPISITDVLGVKNWAPKTHMFEQDEERNATTWTIDAFSNFPTVCETFHHRSVPFFSEYAAPAVCQWQSNSLHLRVYFQHEEEGPRPFASTCHSYSSGFFKGKRSYSGVTTFSKP